MGNRPISIYIHIPFCRSKCDYCDFNSYAGKEHLFESYFTVLKKELIENATLLASVPVKTIYIGGGTPSLPDSRYICECMDLCRLHYNILSDAEISLECNPGTVDSAKLRDYYNTGINRLSVGLQTDNDILLKSVGRIHSRSDFIDSLKLIKKHRFTNFNIDIIIGLPGQSLEMLKSTVDFVLRQDPAHLSCYGLIPEEGTPMNDAIQNNTIHLPPDELEREMYHYVLTSLGEAGYKHYEISNWAKPGFESEHNKVYWRAEEYLGMGAGAASYFNGYRSLNKRRIEDYIEGYSQKEEIEFISEYESMKEFCMLGLRLIGGVSRVEFISRYHVDVRDIFNNNIVRLTDLGLIESDEDGFHLTDKGLDYANIAFSEFV